MHALPRPVRNASYPVPRVVQGDNHRRRRGAARRLGAGGGSGGLPRRQCRYVDLGDITTTVRSPYSPQSVRTAAYHRQLCSIGNWAHGGGTVAAKCSINRRCRRTTTPHLHTKGVPISRSATVQVDGLVCMRSHGRSRNISYPVPRVVRGDNHRRRRAPAKRARAGTGRGDSSTLYKLTTRRPNHETSLKKKYR